MSDYPLHFNKAYDELAISADFKACPEDFCVSEILGFEPEGTGEHVLFNIQKTNITTEAVLSDLAKMLNVAKRDIGCCGLKDKVGVTEQWFSVVIPIKSPIPELQATSWRVLKSIRHSKKLRKGIHQGNQFNIRLRELVGDTQLLEQRLAIIAAEGFPNYFGEQRFGRDGANVKKAESLFQRVFKCKPFQRSMYYSAARSYLFNHYLSLRIADRNWNKAIEGDCFNLAGSNAIFGPEPINEALFNRINQHDIHPVGPLFGDGALRLEQSSLTYAQVVEQTYLPLINGLIEAKIKTAWRPLRVVPKSLHWKIVGNSCELQFFLPVGSYATAMIRETLKINEAVW